MTIICTGGSIRVHQVDGELYPILSIGDAGNESSGIIITCGKDFLERLKLEIARFESPPPKGK